MANQHNKIAHQHYRMTQTPVPKIITATAVPAVANMLITIVYNTVDTFFVSIPFIVQFYKNNIKNQKQ